MALWSLRASAQFCATLMRTAYEFLIHFVIIWIKVVRLLFFPSVKILVDIAISTAALVISSPPLSELGGIKSSTA